MVSPVKSVMIDIFGSKLGTATAKSQQFLVFIPNDCVAFSLSSTSNPCA